LEKERSTKLAKKLRRKSGPDGKDEDKWSRPRGENHKGGWRLREKMGLKNDPLRYWSIVRGVRTVMDNANLDPMKHINHINQQPHGKMHQLKAEARKQMPYLGRFENDWATHEIVKTALGNRRKKIRKEKEVLGEEWTKELKAGGHSEAEDDDGSSESSDGVEDDQLEEAAEEDEGLFCGRASVEI